MVHSRWQGTSARPALRRRSTTRHSLSSTLVGMTAAPCRLTSRTPHTTTICCKQCRWEEGAGGGGVGMCPPGHGSFSTGCLTSCVSVSLSPGRKGSMLGSDGANGGGGEGGAGVRRAHRVVLDTACASHAGCVSAAFSPPSCVFPSQFAPFSTRAPSPRKSWAVPPLCGPCDVSDVFSALRSVSTLDPRNDVVVPPSVAHTPCGRAGRAARACGITP